MSGLSLSDVVDTALMLLVVAVDVVRTDETSRFVSCQCD